jgi:hypothetical protein
MENQAMPSLQAPGEGQVMSVDLVIRSWGSNSWLDCDLILIPGTLRVPPLAVGDALLRISRVGCPMAEEGVGRQDSP